MLKLLAGLALVAVLVTVITGAPVLLSVIVLVLLLAVAALARPTLAKRNWWH